MNVSFFPFSAPVSSFFFQSTRAKSTLDNSKNRNEPRNFFCAINTLLTALKARRFLALAAIIRVYVRSKPHALSPLRHPLFSRRSPLSLSVINYALLLDATKCSALSRVKRDFLSEIKGFSRFNTLVTDKRKRIKVTASASGTLR